MNTERFPAYRHYLTRILTSAVYDVAIESPLDLASNLSHRLGNKIFLQAARRV